MNLYQLTLKSFLTYTQMKIEDNIEKLRMLNLQIEELMEQKQYSTSQQKDISSLYFQNEQIIRQNKTLLTIQNEIARLLQENKNEIEVFAKETQKRNALYESNKTMSKEEAFIKTINGDILLNYAHPYYRDIEFLNRLFKYYLETEAYEQCALIQRLKTGIESNLAT